MSSDAIMHVNRTQPSHFKSRGFLQYMHPELQLSGPSEYDIGGLQLWLHPDQQNGKVSGREIYDYLKEHDMLERCAGWTDLEALMPKGIRFYRRFFSSKKVFGWRSVQLHRKTLFMSAGLYVPCIFDFSIYGVAGSLEHLNRSSNWGPDEPALLFA